MAFKALGEAALYDEAGLPLDRFTNQRRLVGLLALLVNAGDAGMTRDKLTGLLWPDYPPSRARHSLTQALYAARRASGSEDLFVVSETIRLNFDCLDADVREFEAACDEHDWNTAVDLYRGAFLDGFYLPSTEFESWLTTQRQRLEDMALRALQYQVDSLEENEEFGRAVDPARRMAAMRPTDAAIAKRLMRLLAAAGDRAAAVAHANTYAALVRERYEMEPDADVLELAEEIKAAPAQTPSAAERSAALPGPMPRPSEVADRVAARKQRGPARAKLLFAALTLLVVIVIIGVVLARREPRARSAQPRGYSLMVAPFRVTAANDRIHYLSDGMIELLATRFADDATDRSMDAASIIRAWRDRNITGTRAIPLDSILTIAQQLSAERVITGSIVGNAEHLVISASVIASKTGVIVSRATVAGPLDSLTSLVDDLSRKLIVREINAQDELADRTTFSLPALRAYIGGSAGFAQRDYMIALRSYQRASDLDTTFALASLKLALTAARVGEFDRQRAALARAWRSRDNLGASDRALLSALVGPAYPGLSTLRESLSSWNAAARANPDRADVWFGLANATLNAQLAGLAVDDETILAALRRSIALDSVYAQPHLLYAKMQNRPYVAMPDDLSDAGPAALRRLIITSQFSGARLTQARRAITSLRNQAVNSEDALDVLMAEHSLLVMEGKPAGAFESTRMMQRLSPATRVHLRLRILDAIYGDAGVEQGEAAARQLHGAVERMAEAPADACALGQWQIKQNDVAAAKATLKELHSAQYAAVVAGVHPAVCSELLAAGIAVAERSPGAADRLQRLASFNFVSPAAGDAAAYASIALARWYLALNQPQQALATIKRQPQSDAVWPRYRATALRLQAEIALKLAANNEAATALRAYLAFRDDVEAGLVAQVAAARSVLKSIDSNHAPN